MPPIESNSQPEAAPPAPVDLAAAWFALPPAYAIPAQPPTLAEAAAYCRRLARSHYENFSVVTWFLPTALHSHFYNLYAYCRIADDLGDEVGNTMQSLWLLDQWEAELNLTYESLPAEPGCTPEQAEGASAETAEITEAAETKGQASQPEPRHPVFVALRETIRECQIPKEPFADLLKAFRRDQVVQRYETFDELLDYCRFSANPVGRLVLYLCDYRDPELQQLSDFTCTALQLANFWQDVTVDLGKGRVYLPLEDMRRFGVSEDDIVQHRATPEFRALMKFQVQRTREWFERGLPLITSVDRSLAIDLELFSRGGQEILNAIERRDYDVLSSRPSIPKYRKLWLLLRAALKAKLG
jgi:squalene synthase HpnC